MKCESCTLRLWCIAFPELRGETKCDIAEEVAFCILNTWAIGDFKSYYSDDDPGYNFPKHIRQGIADKFFDYIHFMEGKILGIIEEMVKEDIKKGVIK